MITPEELKKLIHYNPDTGIFSWINPTCQRMETGAIISTQSKDGYIKVKIDYKEYRVHRLAFLYMGESMPSNVDHIDGNRINNKWGNLRIASRCENQWNMKKPSTNTSGVKGLCYRRTVGKWCAQVNYRGKFYTKTMKGKEDCSYTKQLLTEWLRATRIKLHGEFANHG